MAAVRRPAPKPTPEAPDERVLVEAAQAEPSKFAALYELHFGRVYAYVARRVCDRSLAEDVTAEVFHRALAGLAKYEWRGKPFAAWLYRIAANAIADQQKRANREQLTGDEPQDAATSATLNPAAAHSEAPSGEFDSLAERAGAVFALVEELPELQRDVLRARFIDERSTKDIAHRLNKTEGAVKQLQFRAIQTLRKQMEGRHA
jgi:RNA polymerase sigma-70 factor (ECF subfamily)